MFKTSITMATSRGMIIFLLVTITVFSLSIKVTNSNQTDDPNPGRENEDSGESENFDDTFKTTNDVKISDPVLFPSPASSSPYESPEVNFEVMGH